MSEQLRGVGQVFLERALKLTEKKKGMPLVTLISTVNEVAGEFRDEVPILGLHQRRTGIPAFPELDQWSELMATMEPSDRKVINGSLGPLLRPRNPKERITRVRGIRAATEKEILEFNGIREVGVVFLKGAFEKKEGL